MQTSRVGKVLAVLIVLLLGAQSQGLAQSFGDSFSVDTAKGTINSSGAPTAQKQDEIPLLQGASCGTIGPQGGDATSIMGVNTAGVVRVTPSSEPFPIIPTFLISLLSLSLLAFGLRALVVKKRAPLWVLGSIIAGALVFAGFLWVALSGSGPTYCFGYSGINFLDEARQNYDSTLSCF